MADEFKPINSQEELNTIIADRIRRAEEAAKKPYADYDSLKTKTESYEKTIADLNDKIKGYEDEKAKSGTQVQELQDKIKSYETKATKIKIAHEVGIPYDIAERLTGDSEDDIRKDAENMARFIAQPQEAPLGNPEPAAATDDTDAALLRVVHDLERR